MTGKTFQFDSQGNQRKMPGWFSWRHQTHDAHDEAVAKYGGTAKERRVRRREEAEGRNALTPVERTRRYRRSPEGRLLGAIFGDPTAANSPATHADMASEAVTGR